MLFGSWGLQATKLWNFWYLSHFTYTSSPTGGKRCNTSSVAGAYSDCSDFVLMIDFARKPVPLSLSLRHQVCHFRHRYNYHDKNISIRTHQYSLEPYNQKSNFPHNKMLTRSLVHVVDNIAGRLYSNVPCNFNAQY